MPRLRASDAAAPAKQASEMAFITPPGERERERERDTELAELEGALPLRLDALLRRTVELLVNHSRPCFVLLKCTEPAPWTARSRALISLFCPSFLASSAAAVLNNDEMLSARVSFILVSFLTCGRNTSPR